MSVKAFETTLPVSVADAGTVVREALSAQGFGVLTEIDVAATLQARLGVERSPLVILGACNPGIADRALTLDPSVALVLPCNVALEGVPEGTRVRIVDPRDLMSDPAFEELAGDAAGKLEAVVATLEAGASG
jgi:uncharacterized protein (DUF302 family)